MPLVHTHVGHGLGTLVLEEPMNVLSVLGVVVRVQIEVKAELEHQHSEEAVGEEAEGELDDSSSLEDAMSALDELCQDLEALDPAVAARYGIAEIV